MVNPNLNRCLSLILGCLTTTYAPLYGDATWIGGGSPNLTDMAQLNNWTNDPSIQVCTFDNSTTVTTPTLTTSVGSPTYFTVTEFNFPDRTIPFTFTISGNNLLQFEGQGIDGTSPYTTVNQSTSSTSDLSTYNLIYLDGDTQTGNVQFNSTIDNMANAGLESQIFIQEMSNNTSPTLLTATSQCTNSGTNTGTVNYITQGQIHFNNDFSYNAGGENSVINVSLTATNTSAGTNEGFLGSIDGFNIGQLSMNVVNVGDALTINALNAGYNNGTNNSTGQIAYVNSQMVVSNSPSTYGDHHSWLATNSGTNGIDNPSAVNSHTIGHVVQGQIVLYGAEPTFGSNLILSATNTGSNNAINATDASTGVSDYQIRCEGNLTTGDQATIIASNTATNSGTNNTGASVGQTNDQVYVANDLSVGANSIISASNSSTSSGVNNGNIGTSNENSNCYQIYVGGSFETTDDTTLTAVNNATNTSTGNNTLNLGNLLSNTSQNQIQLADAEVGNNFTINALNSATNEGASTGNIANTTGGQIAIGGTFTVNGDYLELIATNSAYNGLSNNSATLGSPELGQIGTSQIILNATTSVGNNALIQANNIAHNEGISNDFAQLGMVDENQIKFISTLFAGNDLTVVANIIGTNGETNSSASNTYYFANVNNTQLYFSGAATIGDNAMIGANISAFNGGQAIDSSFIGFTETQCYFNNTLQIGNNGIISAGSIATNTNLNGTSCYIGHVYDQIAFAGTVYMQDNCTVIATNEVINSSTNLGLMGAISDGQISFDGLVQTGKNTSVAAYNILTNTGSNTGSLASIAADQIYLSNNVKMGPNSSISAVNSGNIGENQIEFSSSIVTGRPTINVTNTGTVSNFGIFFHGTSNTDGSIVNVTGSTLCVNTTNSGFLLGGINGDASSTAYFNQVVEINTAQNVSCQFLGAIYDYTASAGLIKSGAGTQILGGTNDFTGNTTINGGNLVLTKTGVLPTDVLINQLGQLSGNGTVIGSVNNLGAIYPGQSVGTLHIQGNYSQGTNGTYIVQVTNELNLDGTGVSSLLDITGTANLAGYVAVVPVDGSYAFNTDYLILTAAGGLGGTTFAGVTSPSKFLVPTLTYDPDTSVFLSLSTQFATGAVTANQELVAQQWDNIKAPSADEMVIMNNLLTLTPQQMPNALEQMTGDQYTYLVELNQYMDQRFSRRIFDAIRNELEPCICHPCCEWFDGWSAFEVGVGLVGNNDAAKGFTTWDIDLSFGAHRRVTPCLVIGGALNLEANFLSFNAGGKPTMYTYQGALYGTYTQDLFYVFTDVVIGQSYMPFKRHINFAEIDRHARCTPELSHGLYYLELGYNGLNFSPFIQPFIGADFDYVNRAVIHEKGADSLNLHVNSKTVSSWNSYLGIHLKQQHSECWNFNVDLAWQHRFGPSGTTIHSHFEDFGTTFPIKGGEPGRNALLADVNLETNLCSGLDAYMELTGEWWDRWTYYSWSIALDYSF